MKLFIAAAIGIACLQGISQPGREQPEVHEIHRPTIIAFFVADSTKSTDERAEADQAEAGSDFSYYASLVKEPLRRLGIDFRISEAQSIQIRNKTSVQNFRSSKLGIGYVFVAPGRRPRVMRGVMTDQDIIEMAKDYFRITGK